MRINDISTNEKSIVLIGFMGVGKTTVGKALATRLNRDFVDIDEEIEKEYKMPTFEIFNKFGEDTFRKKEKDMILRNSKEMRKIISVGGGAFLQEEVKNNCLSQCIVVFLDMSWDSWKERISLLMDSRPVLQGKNIQQIEELFYSRQPIYEEHHYKVLTDHMQFEEAADFIIDLLKTTRDT